MSTQLCLWDEIDLDRPVSGPGDAAYLPSEEDRQLTEERFLWEICERFAAEQEHRTLSEYADLIDLSDPWQLITCKPMQLIWDNTQRTALAYAQELRLSPSPARWPDLISVIAPSGLSMTVFAYKEYLYTHTEEGSYIDAVAYRGTIEGREWRLTVFPGCDPGPDWSAYPEGTEQLITGSF